MPMNECADYWASQGVDPFNAMLTVGCNTKSGSDVLGGVIFLALLILGVVIAKKTGQL
ncbi:MAG: hypothetical protein AAF821_18130 [Cyanobacteria bacterium P01_D01_bin.156]